ncbi:DUF4381 domain-containing protein [Thermomonas brevis]
MSLQPSPSLPLNDVHPGVAPGWWPPAPGWWMVAAAVLILGVGIGLWLHLRRKRTRALLRYFDDAVARADAPVARVAAMSELLRRAARRVDPHADRLQGDDWLRFLDAGLKRPQFLHGSGALLRDGAFRPAADPAAVEALRIVARQRYLDWMRGA